MPFGEPGSHHVTQRGRRTASGRGVIRRAREGWTQGRLLLHLRMFRKPCQYQKEVIERFKYSDDEILGRMFGLLIG